MAALIIAMPSKGRLQENAAAFFARAGLALVQARGAREYRGTIAGLPEVEIAYLSASEIARELAAGNVHFGITGADLVHEAIPDAESRVALLSPLGFGHTSVVVAVPQAWIDVRTMRDLDDVATQFRARHGQRLRVATKYIALTTGFFSKKGVGDYRIVESLGATEGAPAAGTAELIVDITTTGATLRANGLKVLEDGEILRSEAYLVASLGAAWDEKAREAAASVLDRISAEARARGLREVRAAVPAADAVSVAAEAARLHGAAAPFGTDASPLTLHVAAGAVPALAGMLRRAGAPIVTVTELHDVFVAEDALLASLLARLNRAG